MALISWFRDQIQHAAQQYAYVPLEGTPPGDGAAGAPLAAERSYVRLWLAEMALARDREWFTRWHPAVHASVQLAAGSEQQEHLSFAHPLQLPGFEGQLGAIVSLNHPLTPLVPFRGGTLQIVAGLVALPGGDQLARFVKVVGGFASLLGAEATVSVALAGKVAEGIRELLGPHRNAVHLGFHETFTASGGGSPTSLRHPYHAVIAAPARSMKSRALAVAGGRLQLDGKPLDGCTYMLFRVETAPTRGDWQSLGSIAEPYRAALAALAAGERETFAMHARLAKAAALTSPDLTRADRTRLALALHDELRELEDMGLGAVGADDSTLDAIVARRAPTVDEAEAIGPPTLEELLA